MPAECKDLEKSKRHENGYEDSGGDEKNIDSLHALFSPTTKWLWTEHTKWCQYCMYIA